MRAIRGYDAVLTSSLLLIHLTESNVNAPTRIGHQTLRDQDDPQGGVSPPASGEPRRVGRSQRHRQDDAATTDSGRADTGRWADPQTPAPAGRLSATRSRGISR